MKIIKIIGASAIIISLTIDPSFAQGNSSSLQHTEEELANDACVIWKELSEWLPPACVDEEHSTLAIASGTRSGAQFYMYAHNVPVQERIRHTPPENGKVLLGIEFNNNSYQVTENFKKIITNIYGVVAGNPGILYEITGHANRTGIYQRNLTLSENRAKAVHDAVLRNFRTNYKPAPENLSWSGKSWDEPLPHISDPKDGRHRRTEIQAVKRQRGS
ncbi:OmpA family protein [Niveispirillum fermenti]|uniref:OmpA family protein n=1 Tax=Niveispirillum fermenti TaxID=1233113 RepID=UPI003A87B506